MSKLEQLKEKARGLEAKDPKKALDVLLEALKLQEDEGEANPDLSIYNRVGDLYVKLKDPGQAADYYDTAVDRYAELGFHNNAIAMCNKVLRNAPARQTTYLKLAKLYAAKGFLVEAKQNFVEYAERMQRAGKIDTAFAALKEFTDLSPESGNLRHMLEEHLRMYGEPQRRASAGGAPRQSSAPAPPKPPPPPEPGKTETGRRKSTSLVFLDVDEPPAAKGKPAARPGAPPPAPRPPVARAPEPEPDTSLEIETTSLAENEEPGATGGLLEGLQSTSLGAGDLDLEPMAGLEPTASTGGDDEADAETLDEADLILDGNLDVEEAIPQPPTRRPAPPPQRPIPTPPPAVARPPVAKPTAPAAKPRLTMPRAPTTRAPEPPKVKPVVPKRPSQPVAKPPEPSPPPPAKRRTVVEVPPLELETDFEAGTTVEAHDVDDQPLADFVRTEDDTSISPTRRSGYINLGLDGVNQVEPSGSLVFADIEQAPSTPDIGELEARVADDPDDPEAHQVLGEALIEAGERARGIEELDLATAGFENAGNLQHAQDLVDEILRLDPNSVRHRQKVVEFAFKGGDKSRLIDAYLELADTLLRQDLPEKAQAVYRRVADHDPRNERARAALAMLAPAPAPVNEGKVAAKDAKMKVRHEAELGADFVDLGSMILEDDEPVRDTRMTVEDEEPTGDEEKDFRDMLARFKQGIDENIDEADFQSHYDLGVAFKEMGLLDEAIAELQKALRSPEGKLKTSELLGACFFEKTAYAVAESILRRALDSPAAGDQDRLGILYWLGRALEEQGKKAEARDLYGRVFAVEIRFMDVGERVKALARAR